MEFLFILFLIALGFSAGTIGEKKHYKRISSEEMSLRNIPLANFGKDIVSEEQITETRLVSGSVVVSLDYFKRILAGINNIFGGRVAAYETIVDRGRREALLRLKKDSEGYDAIVNLRIDTSLLGGKVGCIEVLANATAVKFASSEKEDEIYSAQRS